MVKFGKQGWVVLGALASLSACSAASSGPSTGGRCVSGKCDDGSAVDLTTFEHRWAIDLRKTKAHYRRTLDLISANAEDMLGQAAATPQGQAIFQQACRPAKLVDGGRVEDGECLAWGNSVFVNGDHTRHVDDPESNPIVNIVETDDDGNVLKQIDQPGYLNIIALLDADIPDQTEVRQHLQNGDILVYFHPDDADVSQYRAHHAAMYYETSEGPLAISLDPASGQGVLNGEGAPFIHHIDNPNSYGPQFNAGPADRPFHVYRFNPNGALGTPNRDDRGLYKFPCNETAEQHLQCDEDADGNRYFTIDDASVDLYRYAMRNWALMANKRVPFASFHSLEWMDADQRAAKGMSIRDEVGQWANRLVGLEDGAPPKVYCAGLVYTNMALGLNYPQTPEGMGAEVYEAFLGDDGSKTYPFNDGYMKIDIPASALAEFASDRELPSLGVLPFEPIRASDIVISWLDGYFGELPRPARANVVVQSAAKIASGFTSLVWASTKLEDGLLPTDANAPVVAEAEKIARFALAYGGWTDAIKLADSDVDESTIAALVKGVIESANETAATPVPPELAEAASTTVAKAIVAGRSERYANLDPVKSLERIQTVIASGVAQALQHAGGRIQLPPGLTPDAAALQLSMAFAGAGMAAVEQKIVEYGECGGVRPGSSERLEIVAEWGLDCMNELEGRYVQNRYVPPFAFHWFANKPESTISYVGTVLHEDLLTCLPGKRCESGRGNHGGTMVGGPDTSLYPNFFVENGGRNVQRVLAVTAGEDEVGPGSSVLVRFSAADVRDMRAVLHPSGWFEPFDALFDEPSANPESAMRCSNGGPDGGPDAACLDADGTPPVGVELPILKAIGLLNENEDPNDDLPTSGPVDNVEVEFPLFTPVTEGGLGCDAATKTCPIYDWERGESRVEDVRELAGARGQWALTLLDRGEFTDGAEIENCAQCSRGGAHSNQWRIVIANDR